MQRIDGDDLRWPRRGTATWAAMQGFRRAVDRWGRREGRGGARKHSEGRGGDGGRGVTVARLRLRSASEGEQRGGGGAERERGGQGGCRGFTRASRGKRQAGGGRDACRRAAATHPRAHWHEVEDDWHMGLVGWLLCWAR